MTKGAKGILITPGAVQGDRAGDREGARRGRDGDRARHPDRAAGRRGRAVRDRQREGRRADRRVGEGEVRRRRASEAKVVTIDLAPGVSVGILRHNGFLKGFGITDKEVLGHADAERRPGQGAGRDGEPAAEGPGRQPRLHDQRAVGVRRLPGAEGGRQGEGRDDRVRRRRLRGDREGHQDRRQISATSQQYPQNMAKLGVEAIAKGEKAPATRTPA